MIMYKLEYLKVDEIVYLDKICFIIYVSLTVCNIIPDVKQKHKAETHPSTLESCYIPLGSSHF